jgi:hypothetical protein
LGAGNMGLARGILHDARDEIQHIAVVVGRGIREVNDVQSGDLFFGGNLPRINSWGRFFHIDDRLDFLEVGKSDVHRVSNFWQDGGQDCRIEALLLDSKLKDARGQAGEDATSGEVGFAMQRVGLRGGTEQHEGRAYGNAIFVRDRDLEFVRSAGESGMSLGKARAGKERQRTEPENQSFDGCETTHGATC